MTLPYGGIRHFGNHRYREKTSRSAVGAVMNRPRYYVPSPETPPANPHKNALSRGEGAQCAHWAGEECGR